MNPTVDELQAALLTAAARTPGAVCMCLDGALGGRPGVVLSLSCEPWVSVPQSASIRALDEVSAALDSLRGPRGVLPAAYGWLSYDALRAPLRGPRTPAADPRPFGDQAPSGCLLRAGPSLHLDLDTGALTFPRRREDARSLERALKAALRRPAARAPLGFRSATDRDGHLANVRAVREAIRAGEVYLVNVARALHADAADGDAVASRVALAGAPYAAVLHAPGALVGGMSMELALAWDRPAGVARTRPIKGTRPRHALPAEDARLAEALQRDPKERAENVMAVDVHRNDLGRVASPGGVTVPALCAVESHQYVHHLVSTVEARVPLETSARALLGALLPVGSVTGAPKLAAMDTIQALERERRGLYTGVYGCAFGDGSLALAVAIRTLVLDPGGLHYGVGGGIVWDSDPLREWDELGWKQRGVE
ncbi:MAG: chorismate-binding protein [Deltaproteobacteria bacterium]|nr:chorismate-binding protein [Deltaproteobacteria bacterium]